MKRAIILTAEAFLFGLILWGAIFGTAYLAYPPY